MAAISIDGLLLAEKYSLETLITDQLLGSTGNVALKGDCYFGQSSSLRPTGPARPG